MRAFKLYIGSDNASHVLEGEVALDKSTDVVSLHFQESPPGSASIGTSRRSGNTFSR